MKRYLAALLAVCALALAGCAGRASAPAAPAPAAPAPASPAVPAAAEPSAEAPAASADDGVTVLDCGGLEIPVPTDYLDQLIADTAPEAWSEHWEPLLSLTEKASVEDFTRDHPGEDWGVGWLCTVARLDRIGFEEWASGDETGTSLFARDDAGYYYLVSRPTDVRLYRSGGEMAEGAGLEGWNTLNAWAEGLPDAVIGRNGLTAYDARELFDYDYTYPGAHVELGCRFPGEPMDLAVLSLSQPARQGEGGVWCVERIRFVYGDYGWTETHLVFPAALGIDETAADYYAHLQAECDAGAHDALLTPRGAAQDYARRSAWLFGEDISASDFEEIRALG